MSMAATENVHPIHRAGHKRFSPDKFIDALRGDSPGEKMTPKELAAEMGASVEAVARWMAGIAEPKPGYATQAARILGVNVEDLYEES